MKKGVLLGIFHWAYLGWKRLNHRGRFHLPAASTGTIQEMEDLGSPVAAFLRDFCEIGPGFRVKCDELFNRWKNWCQSEGRDRVVTKATFGRDIMAAVLQVKRSRGRDGSSRYYYYEGIRCISMF